MDVVDGYVLRVLVVDTLGAFLEFLLVFGGPPVFQIAFGIKLAAFVVKGVSEFVANGAASVAVVGSVVHLCVVERGLQDSGGKVNVVHLRIVVRVDGRRRDQPFAAVHGDADVVQLPPRFKDGGVANIPREIVRLDDH